MPYRGFETKEELAGELVGEKWGWGLAIGNPDQSGEFQGVRTASTLPIGFH